MTIPFDNFHVNLKNTIGFAVAVWERAEPAPYYKRSKMGIFKCMELTWIIPVPMDIKIRVLDKEHNYAQFIHNYVRASHSFIVCWGNTKTLGQELPNDEKRSKLSFLISLSHNCWCQQKLEASLLNVFRFSTLNEWIGDEP